MPDPIADFRSDTVTTPTPAMREAMATARVGDDVFGEDPTVIELQEEAARVLGKEAALFTPSGTMANEIAVALHAGRGDEILLEEWSHIFQFEGGAASWISGAQVRTLPSDRGTIAPETVRKVCRGDDSHEARTALLCVENTHNMHGGAVVSLEALQALRDVAVEKQLKLHLDGARLFNAVAATGTPAADFAACADTVQICLSKGLGAPVGSLIAGTNKDMAKAHRVRKVLGGGMRQAGIIAAAGLIALRDHPAKLVEDHTRARNLAAGFRQAIADTGSGEAYTAIEPDTNMVFVRCDDAGWIADRLGTVGVRTLYIAGRGLRFVLHHQIDDAMVSRAIQAFHECLRTGRS